MTDPTGDGEPGIVHYPGQELELFARARNWKSYVGRVLAPHLAGDVLEVGAGLGANIPMLCGDPKRLRSWTGLEPDPGLFAQLQDAVQSGHCHPVPAEAILGTLSTLDSGRRFDTLVYLDVLEHIEDDHGEFRRACSRLVPGGKLLILCPAHPSLFSPFDAAIGHYRRHTKASFRALPRDGVTLTQLRYLDSVGLLASAANRLLLSQSMPTENQILLWDRIMVPISRGLDPVLVWSLGKSVFGVWEKTGEP